MELYTLSYINGKVQDKERHWLIPLRKGAQYKMLRKLGKGQELIELILSPQAPKKWVDAPVTMEARLVTTTIKRSQSETI